MEARAVQIQRWEKVRTPPTGKEQKGEKGDESGRVESGVKRAVVGVEL